MILRRTTLAIIDPNLTIKVNQNPATLAIPAAAKDASVAKTQIGFLAHLNRCASEARFLVAALLSCQHDAIPKNMNAFDPRGRPFQRSFFSAGLSSTASAGPHLSSYNLQIRSAEYPYTIGWNIGWT